jgi:hypothetical protein
MMDEVDKLTGGQKPTAERRVNSAHGAFTLRRDQYDTSHQLGSLPLNTTTTSAALSGATL